MASVASALARTRTFRAPFRLNQRRLASIALMLAAALGGFAYTNGVGQAPTYPVLLATRDLPRGAVLGSGDLRPDRVPLPEAMAAAVLPSSAIPQTVGQRLVEPVHAGVPVLRAQLAGAADLVAGYQRIAFPVGPEHAAGGRLASGDTVRVFVTTGRGKPDARTSMVLDRATVSSVGYQEAALGTGAAGPGGVPRGKLAWMELLVPDARAQDFLQALATGDPDVSVLPPDGTTAAPTRRESP